MEKVIVPAPAVTFRADPPSTVLEKRMFPPVEFNVVVEVRLTAFANEIDPVPASVPCKFTPPPPLCAKVELNEVAAPATKVNVPLLITAKGPLFVVIRFPLMLIPLDPPRTVTPDAPFVLRSPP